METSAGKPMTSQDMARLVEPDPQNDEINRLKAERDRLREALRSIENMSRGLKRRDLAMEFVHTTAEKALKESEE